MTLPTSENAEASLPTNSTAVAERPSAEPATSSGRRHPANKSKKDQLLALIAKSGGLWISVLTERLGWQPHTVRAALSGLRKHGHQILASKAPKTGESVYRLVSTAELKAETIEVLAP